MADNPTTPTTPTRKSRSRSTKNAGGKHRGGRRTEDTKAPAGVNNSINFRAEAGADNPIWQAVNYAYNRLCGAHQNQTTPFSAIELLNYAREKFGPKTMTVGSQAA